MNSSPLPPPHLAGARVLVVEDEYFLASELAHLVENLGAQVIGPVSTVEAAEALIESERPDCAILDMNLRGRSGQSVADRLEGRGIPCLVLSGYDRATLPERIRKLAYLEKPATSGAITARLSGLLAAKA